MEVAPYCMGGH